MSLLMISGRNPSPTAGRATWKEKLLLPLLASKTTPLSLARRISGFTWPRLSMIVSPMPWYIWQNTSPGRSIAAISSWGMTGSLTWTTTGQPASSAIPMAFSKGSRVSPAGSMIFLDMRIFSAFSM